MPSNVIGHELRAEIIVDVSYPGWYRNESAMPAGAHGASRNSGRNSSRRTDSESPISSGESAIRAGEGRLNACYPVSLERKKNTAFRYSPRAPHSRHWPVILPDPLIWGDRPKKSPSVPFGLFWGRSPRRPYLGSFNRGISAVWRLHGQMKLACAEQLDIGEHVPICSRTEAGRSEGQAGILAKRSTLRGRRVG
jgi:hypothetical protein